MASEPKNKAKAKPAKFTDPESARLVLGLVTSRIDPEPADRNRLDPEWGELAIAAVESGEAGIEACLKAIKVRSPDDAKRYREAIDGARVDPVIIQMPGHEEKGKPALFDLGILGTAEFATRDYPREFLIENVLVAKRPTILAGPKKALKTTFLIQMVLALASARPFLGEFAVNRRVKTLLISGESGGSTIQETMRRMCRSMDITPDDVDGFAFWGFTLPQLSDADQVEAMAAFIRANGIEVVMVDPIYLCMPKIDPANLFDVGPLLKRVSDACLDAGATPILAHHFRKNRESPYDPPESDDIAFAGFQEFARQWLMVSRRNRFEPGSGEHELWFAVGGSDGHSGEWAVDIREGTTDASLRDRDWLVTIAHASEARNQAKEKAAAAKEQSLTEKAAAKAEAKEGEDRRAMDRVLEILGAAPGRKATVATIRSATSWRKDKADHILFRLEGAGVVVRDDVPTDMGNGKTRNYPGFRLVEGVSQ